MENFKVIEVKEMDLEQEIKNEIVNLSNLYCYMEDLFNGNEEEGVYPIPEKVKNELFEFAKHFFELGMRVNNPITADDEDVVEEIILSLKQVENDYHIDHTKEIEWLRNKVKKVE